MISRREYLKMMVAAGVALSLNPTLSWARGEESLSLITRAIPSSGERLPVVGLGSSATFRGKADDAETDALRQVLSRLAERENSVFDTAPGYGASEEVAGRIVNELDVADRLFWATKLNVARRGGRADADAAWQQVEQSFERIGKDPIDLIQVHNLGDVPTQLGILKELREAERLRYIGVTTTFPGQYEQLEEIMKREPLDFIGVDYAVDNRTMEERIFPLAEERGIGVLVYAPFGRTRLWDKVSGRELPEWAAEFDADSWAQFFLKFVVSHPVVTAATPATSRPRHMVDNMGAALGRLPDEEMRERMVRHIESL